MKEIQMQGIYFLLSIGTVIGVMSGIAYFIGTLVRKRPQPAQPAPYFRKKTLIHEREQILYHLLIEAMPGHHIMTQVRLADIVEVNECDNRMAWFKKVSQKSVDFVICNKRFFVIACIELDGITHLQERRKIADAEKDTALKTAGIPIIRIKAHKIPTAEELKKMIENAFLHRKP